MGSPPHPNGILVFKQEPLSQFKLSNDILLHVLDFLSPDPDKFITPDKREYLSQESFQLPPSPPPDQAKDLGNFRLVNKRFAELGAPRQFPQVTTRFSIEGFERLQNIAGQEHLAKCVKKFSYMVPYFYTEGKDRVPQVLQSLDSNFGELDVSVYHKKINAQRTIVGTKKDLRSLTNAFAAFRNLTHFRILALQDQADASLLAHLRHHEEDNQFVELMWPPAYSHSVQTIGSAMIASHRKCERFSSPMTDPQSAIMLAQQLHEIEPETFDRLGLRNLLEGLTNLELHLPDDGLDLDEMILQLSPLFKIVFQATKNLQTLHVGFPTHRPLGLRLEDVFHHVRWEKLIAFGIQSWRLDTDQIIELVSRHRRTLVGLRLRDVLLTEGSMWKDVLQYLRPMKNLKWVSLRRIGYAAHFDAQPTGGEIQDDWPGGYVSDSDDATDATDEGAVNGNINGYANGHPVGHHSDVESIGSESNGEEEDDSEDDEHGPNANEMEFPHQLQSDISTSFIRRVGGLKLDELESMMDLGDNGVEVSRELRKLWEQWVIRDHGPEQNSR